MSSWQHVGDRDTPRSELLEMLGKRCPGTGPWKGVESFLEYEADLDYAAPVADWPDIRIVFEEWAGAHGLELLPQCSHRFGAMYLLAVEPDGKIAQLDVRSEVTYRGVPLFEADQLQPLREEGPSGLNSVRIGSSALFNLVLKCLRPDGTVDRSLLVTKGVLDGLRQDIEGAYLAAALNPRLEPLLRRVVDNAIEGSRDPASGRRLIRAFEIERLRHPVSAVRQLIAKRHERKCPFLQRVLNQEDLGEDATFAIEMRSVHRAAPVAGSATSPPARGAHIVFVGPDGVGKTTLRAAIARRLEGEVDVLSDRGVGPLVRKRARSGPRPATRTETFPWIWGETKSFYLFVDRILRAIMVQWPHQRRGGWVLTERGWWDMAVYPRRYGMRRRGLIHRLLSPFVPRAHLIIILEADAQTILERKQELTAAEVIAQSEAWRSVVPPQQPRVILDSTLPREVLLDRAGQAIRHTVGWFPSMSDSGS